MTNNGHWNLSRNKFQNNIALISGGAISLSNTVPLNLISDNDYINNTAWIYGDHYASDPIRFVLSSI